MSVENDDLSRKAHELRVRHLEVQRNLVEAIQKQIETVAKTEGYHMSRLKELADALSVLAK
jgi:hypothetical protein